MANNGVSKEWLKAQHEKDLKIREENSKYESLKIGENVIKIDVTKVPMETQNRGGFPRFVWTTEKVRNGANLLLSASPTLNGMIVEALLKDINPFTIVKTGTGVNTRWSIKELQ